MMNETQLIDKIKLKDEDAFACFLDKYMKVFYNIVKRILVDVSTHEDIMDCLSESYIYIWYHIDNYDSDKYAFRNWCCLIVISRAQNHLNQLQRHKNKLVRFQEQMTDHNKYAPSAEDMYMDNETTETVIDKLHILSPISREVVKMRYIYGLMPKQIAQEMDITVKQVDNYLAHAKKKLRKEGFLYEIE